MGDISHELAGLISSSKVFNSSANIRHGKYRFLIKRIFADLIETANGKQKMAFVEYAVDASYANPQIEGDRGPDGKLVDDGTTPNPVGSYCALKVNFDGPGARSAGANLKAFILGLFGKREGEISDADVNSTWLDLSRQKDEWLVKGYLLNGQVVAAGTPGATEAWVPLVPAGGGFMPVTAQTPGAVFKQANPACGMLIGCYTKAHKKKVPNEKGAYITKTMWECVAPPGTGENALELVLKRRQEIERALSVEADEEESAVSAAPVVAAPPVAPSMSLMAGAAQNGSQNGTQYAAPAPAQPMAIAPIPAPPAPPAAPPPPPAPPAVFTPMPPWKLHPTAVQGKTPETIWYWSDPSQGGSNDVKNEAQLRQH